MSDYLLQYGAVYHSEKYDCEVIVVKPCNCEQPCLSLNGDVMKKVRQYALSYDED